MIVYDNENVDKLYISPYVKMSVGNGGICFYQSLTGKSYIIPGGENELIAFIDGFLKGKNMEEANGVLAEIFHKYDSEELLVGMIQMGVLE